jgi:hypothetical protein
VATIRAKTKDDPLLSARAAYYTQPFEEMFREAKDVLEGSRVPLIAQKVGEDPKIDGKLDEPAWQRATEANLINAYDREHKTPKFPTGVRAVWTARGLTLGFRCHEPDVAAIQKTRTGRDHSTLYWDDNVEMIFDVTGKGAGDYVHFIISAAGVVADARGQDYSWNLAGIQTGTAIGQDEWTAEIFLPFDSFGADALKPGSGTNTQWLGNIMRHRVATGDGEQQRLNTTYAVPNENLSDLAPIVFRE